MQCGGGGSFMFKCYLQGTNSKIVTVIDLQTVFWCFPSRQSKVFALLCRRFLPFFPHIGSRLRMSFSFIFYGYTILPLKFKRSILTVLSHAQTMAGLSEKCIAAAPQCLEFSFSNTLNL